LPGRGTCGHRTLNMGRPKFGKKDSEEKEPVTSQVAGVSAAWNYDTRRRIVVPTTRRVKPDWVGWGGCVQLEAKP